MANLVSIADRLPARPWGPEHPIFGLVRYMALSGMQRKMDTRAYIYKWRRQ